MIKPVVVRAQADKDLDAAIAYYLREAPPQVERLLASFERTFHRIGRLPKAGSPRFAVELEIEGLRHVASPRFPYLVFYVERPDAVDVVRVLHRQRDIPELLLEDE